MNQKQEIGEIIKTNQSIHPILDKLKRKELIVHEAAIAMIGVSWSAKFRDSSREKLLELIKILIAQGAKYNLGTRNIIKSMIKLDQEGIEEIEEFHKKYQTFAKSTLKHLCLKFFKEKNENLDSDKYNIPFELKREFSKNG